MNLGPRNKLHNREKTLGAQRGKIDEINQVKSCKDLGVTLTNKLQWSKQVTVVTGRVTKVLNIVKIISGSHLYTYSKRLLYLALVHSHLGYASNLLPYLHRYDAALNFYSRPVETTEICVGRQRDNSLVVRWTTKKPFI